MRTVFQLNDMPLAEKVWAENKPSEKRERKDARRYRKIHVKRMQSARRNKLYKVRRNWQLPMCTMQVREQKEQV
jgi:hypothetical protein